MPALSSTLRTWLFALVVLACHHKASAQWVTESYPLKVGWNAVWLPLDLSHDSMDITVHPSIVEIWKWNNYEAATFTDNPAGVPSQIERQWEVWRRGDPINSTFSQLSGNTAYLVKVANTPSAIVWNAKGKPLSPHYDWTSSGTNLIGFPLQTPSDGVKRGFDKFFGFDSVLKVRPNTYYYNGGAESNETLKIASNTFALSRFQAYWVQAGAYTEYYGPIKVEVTGINGLKFGTDVSSISVRITNTVDIAKNSTVTVTIAPKASESPPAGQTAVAGPVPLKLRGGLNLGTGSYNYATVDVAHPATLVLPPQASEELIFTVDRSQMSPAPNLAYQSLLSITDSLDQTRIMLPVSAEPTPRTGLWVGTAVLNQADLVVGGTITTQTAPTTFPLRLVMHSDGTAKVRLLQEAFTGKRGDDIVCGASEASFGGTDTLLSRVASAHFPTHTKVNGTGTLGLSGTVTFSIPLGYNDPSNPFVHSYHPDHDNMDDRFQSLLPAGRESNNITRLITLTFTDQNPGGFDPTWGATILGGTYQETVTGLRATPIKSGGVFAIKRVATSGTFLDATP